MAILRNQKNNNDCGPTCFANALNILGYDIKIEQANKLCNLRKEGTDSDDLSRAFNKYGFDIKERIHYSEEKAWFWLIEDTSKGLPVIISVDDDGHWLLVLRAGKRNAQIIDPSSVDPERVSKKKLLERWQLFEDKRVKPRFHGLSFKPFKDKSIKAVQVREKLLATIDIR